MFERYLRERGVPFAAGEPLARHTTFGIGGPAEWFVRPRTPDEAADVLRRAHEDGVPIRVLGGGANVLAPDEGVRGVVLNLASLDSVRFGRDTVEAGAGANFPRLCAEACRRGHGGLEGLAGIPGTLGGAIAMNAGGRYGEIGPLVEWVDLATPAGIRRVRPSFRYRGSDINGGLVLAARLRTRPDDPTRLATRFREVLDEKHRTQPMNKRCAGCMFRNPDGVPAGRLIEECGLKGAREGAAVVSPLHANFIVNEGGARAADVRRLAERVRDTVRRLRGVELDFEVVLW